MLIGNLWRVFFQSPCPAVSPSSKDVFLQSKEIFFYYLLDYFSLTLFVLFLIFLLDKCQNVCLNSFVSFLLHSRRTPASSIFLITNLIFSYNYPYNGGNLKYKCQNKNTKMSNRSFINSHL